MILREFSAVRLLRDVEQDGARISAGTRGVIVAMHGIGEAYEVEIAIPEVVITVPGDWLASEA